MRRFLLFALAAAMTTPAAAKTAPPPCVMTPAERAWLDRAMSAWVHMRDHRLRLAQKALPPIDVFNTDCQFRFNPASASWHAQTHSGQVELSNGWKIPAGVVAMAADDDKLGTPFFAMALPSIWEAAKVTGALPNDLGLTAVFLHEFAHTASSRVYKPRGPAADAAWKGQDKSNINDDSLQKRFQSDPAYVAVYEKERDLLYEAAAEPDDAKARDLVGKAVALMKSRQQRWFRGEDSYWIHFDDPFLTDEGVGQWVAYAWLSDPKGGGLTRAEAERGMRGPKTWWSQEAGLGAMLVIDRFMPGWPSRIFSETRPAYAIELLNEIAAVRKPAPSS